MKYLIKILVFVLIWNVGAYSQKYIEATYQCECKYRVISAVLPFNIDSIVADYFEDYKEFKDELADSVNYWVKEYHKQGDCIAWPCDRVCKPNEIKAIDIIDFTGDSTFILLRYWDSDLRFYYAGYCIKQDQWFPLVDIEGDEIAVNFNKILKLCPSMNNKSPLCKSVLLLGLKYVYPDNGILYNIDDIAGIISYNYSKENPVPDSMDFARPLYIMGISEDTSLNKYFDQKRFNAYKNATRDLRNYLSFIPPRIKYGELQDTVELTLFNRNYGEIAEWRLVYNKDGQLDFMDFIREPIVTVYGVAYSPSGSPMRIRKYGEIE